jgi:signal peptide peptidase SppA
MSENNESIFRYSIKRFIGTFAALIGIFIALFTFSTFIGFAFKNIPEIQENLLPLKVMPNQMGDVSVFKKDSNVILQIDLEGIIGIDRKTENTSAKLQKILKQPHLQRISMDQVKGIFITINSRGGSAAECAEMYQDLIAFKQQYNIPIHVWISDVCASAGYYLACSGDYISAQSTTMIGSVGVFFPPQFNFYNLMQKVGVEAMIVNAGKNKIPFPMFTPLVDGTSSYKDIIKIANDVYENFITVVDSARASHGLTKAKLIEYGAAIYGSLDAQKLGYIDAANTRYFEALAHMKKSLELDENTQVISFVQKKAFYESLKNALQNKLSFLFGTNQDTSLPFTLEAPLFPNQL